MWRNSFITKWHSCLYHLHITVEKQSYSFIYTYTFPVTFGIFCTSENIHLLQQTIIFAVVLPYGIEKVSVIETFNYVLLFLESKVVKNRCQISLIVSSRDPNPSPSWIPFIRAAEMF